MKKKKSKESWGGPWTEKKLETFEKYVRAYLFIMNKYPFWKTIYFDGFAGSGERIADNQLISPQLSLEIRDVNIYQGAAERIAKINHPVSFDFYYFIDKNETSSYKLKTLLESRIPEKKDKFVFRNSDCDTQLEKLANAMIKQKSKYAALILIDPFGMHISWDTISKLKNSRSDVWILVPTGVIVNRLLDKKGELKSINKLEYFFGMSEANIRKEFYTETKHRTLFDEEVIIWKKVPDPINHIARIYRNNLNSVWDYVTDAPLRLDNSSGTTIFHFIFASNNKFAAKVAQEVINKQTK